MGKARLRAVPHSLFTDCSLPEKVKERDIESSREETDEKGGLSRHDRSTKAGVPRYERRDELRYELRYERRDELRERRPTFAGTVACLAR